MKRLVRKASNELVRRRVEDTTALRAEVYASLVDHLDRLGALRIPPFDKAPCERASLQNLSRKRIDWERILRWRSGIGRSCASSH